MEKQPSLLLAFLFFIIVSCYIAETRAKKQEQRLGHLYKAKLKENSGIDTSLFKTIHNVSRATIHSQDGLKENDRIEKLPGQPVVEFSQYGGYVTVDESAGRAMYYYFVEAQKSKDSAPLLLWLNGGKCLMPWPSSPISQFVNSVGFFFFFKFWLVNSNNFNLSYKKY